MKILMAYQHYPMSIGRYWKAGLRQAGHEVDSIGFSTGASQAWPGNPQLPAYVDHPTFPLSSSRNVYPIDEHLRAICESGDYDAFVNVDAAHYWAGTLPIPKIIIGTDPHCLDYSKQRADCDRFVCMQKSYSQLGDVWIPYAYDEEHHFDDHSPVPDRDLGDYAYDIGFLGVEYDVRKRELDAMAAAGFAVKRGVGIILSEASQWYGDVRFAYCTPSLLDLPTRFFEAMAMGCIPLIKWIPELENFDCENLIHYVGYDALPIARLRVLLNDEERLNDIRDAGKEWVRPHTWRSRAEQLVGVIEEVKRA